jgi:hypothetical protein
MGATAGAWTSKRTTCASNRPQLLAGDGAEFQGNHFYPADWHRYQFVCVRRIASLTAVV